MPHPLVVNIRTADYDVFCGRGSDWGNDWTHLPLSKTQAKYQVHTREESISAHRADFLSKPELVAKAKRELKGKRLGCYCAPKSCHCDILAEVANEVEDESSKA